MADAVTREGYTILEASDKRRGGLIAQAVDAARDVLWRAFQRGEVSIEEFARMAQRLEKTGPAEHPRSDESVR